MEDYSGYGWIKVKRYVDDPTLTWEERYARLDSHHTKETTFLINKVRELAKELNDIKYPPQPVPITKEMIEELEAKIPNMEVGRRNACDARGHGMTQQFTEVCMECWRNSYETDKEYYQYLQELYAKNRTD
jgi:hypothetical protein